MSQSQANLREHTSLATNLLQALGFVINWEKSELKPVQRIVYLCFLIDSIFVMISLPADRVKKLRKKPGSMLQKKEISLKSCFIHRPSKFHNSSCTPSSIVVQKSSGAKNKTVSLGRNLRLPCETFTSRRKRAHLVERGVTKMEWPPSTGSRAKGIYWKRCIQYRLGGHSRKSKSRRILVRHGKENAYKCSRIAGSKVRHSSFLKRKSSQPTDHPQDRQLNHSFIHKQDGQNTFDTAQHRYPKSLAVVFRKKVPSSSRTYSHLSPFMHSPIHPCTIFNDWV